jgi:hypothetical protein
MIAINIYGKENIVAPRIRLAPFLSDPQRLFLSTAVISTIFICIQPDPVEIPSLQNIVKQ